MRSDASRDDWLDPLRAWTRQRERLHRARVSRILLPALPPVVVGLLLLTRVLDLPSRVVDVILWLVALLAYGALWLFLIRDAHRFVEEATEIDTQFRTMMGDPLPAESEAGGVPAFGVAGSGPVIAVAGRRIDARDADTDRFPLALVGEVKQRLQEYFDAVRPSAVVSSAACGADLLALDVAGAMNVPRRVVLPFRRPRFRHKSVTDRPGRWGQLFDRIVDALPEEDLIILSEEEDGTAAYEATNLAILEHAAGVAARVPVGAAGGPPGGVIALLVWDGVPRGDDDLTEHFRRAAERRGFPIEMISTL